MIRGVFIRSLTSRNTNFRDRERGTALIGNFGEEIFRIAGLLTNLKALQVVVEIDFDRRFIWRLTIADQIELAGKTFDIRVDRQRPEVVDPGIGRERNVEVQRLAGF